MKLQQPLDGLVSFFSSHYAIRANSLLSREGFASELTPGPKELSPNCGVALRITYEDRARILAILKNNKVQIDSVHLYRPAADQWQGDLSSD